MRVQCVKNVASIPSNSSCMREHMFKKSCLVHRKFQVFTSQLVTSYCVVRENSFKGCKKYSLAGMIRKK